jgi:hypothetical protein
MKDDLGMMSRTSWGVDAVAVIQGPDSLKRKRKREECGMFKNNDLSFLWSEVACLSRCDGRCGERHKTYHCNQVVVRFKGGNSIVVYAGGGAFVQMTNMWQLELQ